MEALRHAFSRINQWVRHHRPQTILIVGLVLIVGAGVGVYAFVSRPLPQPEAPAPKVEKAPEPVVYYSPLTGLKVKNAAAQTAAVTGIMIENSPDARPQSGLKAAGVVYEAIAEGGITRFLALYQESKPQLIGPVRSVRPYFIDWVEPYNASIAHVGGSYEALNEIRNGTHRDIDQFFYGNFYWRSTDRYAPHNVYTSFKRLDALNKSKGYTSSHFTGFKRDDVKPATKPAVTRISMKISSALFNPSYTYDSKHDVYKRNLAGSPHLDREKGQITPKVVIAMLVKERNMNDGLHQEITTSGTGTAYIFQGGTVTKVTWHKKNSAGQLSFTDKDGKEIALARGQTWITALPNQKGSVSWK